MVRVPRGVGLRTRSGPEGSSLSDPRQAQWELPDRSEQRRRAPVSGASTRGARSVTCAYGAHRLKISHERFARTSAKPGGTLTGR